MRIGVVWELFENESGLGLFLEWDYSGILGLILEREISGSNFRMEIVWD